MLRIESVVPAHTAETGHAAVERAVELGDDVRSARSEVFLREHVAEGDGVPRVRQRSVGEVADERCRAGLAQDCRAGVALQTRETGADANVDVAIEQIAPDTGHG